MLTVRAASKGSREAGELSAGRDVTVSKLHAKPGGDSLAHDGRRAGRGFEAARFAAIS